MISEFIFIIILLLPFLFLLFFLKLATGIPPPLPYAGRSSTAECLKAVADNLGDESVRLVNLNTRPLSDGRSEVHAELANSVVTIMYHAICSQASSSENIRISRGKVMMDFLNGTIVYLQTPYGKRHKTKLVPIAESHFAYEIWRIVRNQLSQPKLG